MLLVNKLVKIDIKNQESFWATNYGNVVCQFSMEKNTKLGNINTIILYFFEKCQNLTFKVSFQYQEPSESFGYLFSYKNINFLNAANFTFNSYFGNPNSSIHWTNQETIVDLGPNSTANAWLNYNRAVKLAVIEVSHNAFQ